MKEMKKKLCKISINGKILEQAKEVAYLGNKFSRDGRYEIDEQRRLLPVTGLTKP